MLVKELSFIESTSLVGALQNHQDWVWLDKTHPHTRYEYLCFWPYKIDLFNANQMVEAIRSLQHGMVPLAVKNEHLPPFQGGCVGLWHYDAGVQLPIKRGHRPAIELRWYDVFWAWDHELKKTFLVSTGASNHDALVRLEQAEQLFASQCKVDPVWPELHFTEGLGKKHYQSATLSAQEMIRNGDVFELNLTQQWRASRPDQWCHLAAYLYQRNRQKATMGAFWSGEQTLLSFSPERFVSVNDGLVSTCPIKGSEPRGRTDEEDRMIQEKLQHSTKNIAENAMIVDLMRHDLSYFCLPESIEVSSFCALHSFAHVHHLISTVTGRLKSSNYVFEMMSSLLPAGSITGAPKQKAIELIDQLEPVARGPYTGCLTFHSRTGDMDSSVLIRTLVADEDNLHYHAGGAVTLLSDPLEEYQEALFKAQSITEHQS